MMLSTLSLYCVKCVVITGMGVAKIGCVFIEAGSSEQAKAAALSRFQYDIDAPIRTIEHVQVLSVHKEFLQEERKEVEELL